MSLPSSDGCPKGQLRVALLWTAYDFRACLARPALALNTWATGQKQTASVQAVQALDRSTPLLIAAGIVRQSDPHASSNLRYAGGAGDRA